MLVILQAASLKGPERFYVDLKRIHMHIDKGKNGVLPPCPFRKETCLVNAPHMILCLAGKFKGETGHWCYMLLLTSNTLSGIWTCWWIEKLTEVQDQWCHTTAPVFCYQDRKLDKIRGYDKVFHRFLERVQLEPGSLVPLEDKMRRLYRFLGPHEEQLNKENSWMGWAQIFKMSWTDGPQWRPQEPRD